MKKLFVLCLLAIPVVAEEIAQQTNPVQELIQENSVKNLAEIQKEEKVEIKSLSEQEQLPSAKVELKQNIFEELPPYSLVRIHAEDARARDKKADEIIGFFKKTNINALAIVVGKAINSLDNVFYDGAKEKVDLLEKVLHCAAHDKDRANNNDLEAYCKECLQSETVEEMAKKISFSLLQHEKPEVAVEQMEIVRKTVERLKARN